ncbi:MAG: hypothetical protein ACOH1X_01665 [Kaistella sp.]
MKILSRNILLAFVLFNSSMAFSQNYDCNNVSFYKVKDLYNENKSHFIVYYQKQDVMEIILDKSSHLMAQACIDSWAESEKYGKKYLYDRFVSEYGDISKDYYYKNIEYFEIIRRFNRIIKTKFGN